jgi:dTDP-4-amino-4,6-dideoxygalactose transaminase
MGGTPAINLPAPHFSWPPLNETATAALLQQLQTSISIYDRSGVIADLEDALSGYHDAAHALLTSSGTVALYSAYAACALGPGDEVIVPAYTFLATATPLLHVGATPVLVDSDDTGNIDPRLVEQAITPRTKAIVVTHMWGYPAQAGTLRDLADHHNLWLIEDGSHAHGASVRGRKVGTFGHIAAFSMNGPKPLSAGEGGFLLTDDDELHHRALLHGHYNKRCRTELPSSHPLYRYATTGMGLKFRIHPLAAAIALDQLTHLDEYLTGRAKIADYMATELNAMPGIRAQTPNPGEQASWYGLIVHYQPDQAHDVSIDQLHQALHAEGAREVDRPLLPHFPGTLTYKPGDFPVAERVHRLSLKLPVWHRDDDMALVDDYLEAFGKITSNYPTLARNNP